MAKKKTAEIPPKLTEGEQDLLSQRNTAISVKRIRWVPTRFSGR